jgi:hypothetical protein
MNYTLQIFKEVDYPITVKASADNIHWVLPEDPTSGIKIYNTSDNTQLSRITKPGVYDLFIPYPYIVWVNLVDGIIKNNRN